MDAQAIGPVEKNSNQVSRSTSPSGGKLSTGGSTTVVQTDTVSLSQRGQAAVIQQVQSIGGNRPGSELRKIDVTDDNKVIVKVVDSETQEVVRQIPKAEEVRLKKAIQENLDNLTDSDSGEHVDATV